MQKQRRGLTVAAAAPRTPEYPVKQSAVAGRRFSLSCGCLGSGGNFLCEEISIAHTPALRCLFRGLFFQVMAWVGMLLHMHHLASDLKRYRILIT